MTGIWTEADGLHTYVGDLEVPISDQPWSDVVKFLHDNGFKERETTSLPSSAGAPVAERTYEHADGRMVMLTERLTNFGFPVIGTATGGDSADDSNPIHTVGDLVKLVTMGRQGNAPEREGLANQGKDPVSSAIGSVYSGVEAKPQPTIYSKSFRRIGLALKNVGPMTGTATNPDNLSGAQGPIGGQEKVDGGYENAAANIHGGIQGSHGGVVRGEQYAQMPTNGPAQDPVAGGTEHFEQASRMNPALGGLTGRQDDQSMTRTNPNPGGLNPMYGGQSGPKGSFEEAMQSPAYTSDDGMDLWNTYKESDLEPPDEVEITLDPMTGEVMFVSYEYENSTQLPFMGTPAMPVSPFANSPQPTPMTEEAPQKQIDPMSGSKPSGVASGNMGQPHMAQNPSMQAPPQSQTAPKTPPQAQRGQSQQGPQPGSQQWISQTPNVPDWTSPDPTGNEEGHKEGTAKPSPNIQLQRAFRKMARYGK